MTSPQPFLPRAPRSLGSLLGFAAVTAAAAGVGGLSSAKSLWFRKLKKPPFQPPPAVFGPVWTVLYSMIAVSGWRVWRGPRGVNRSAALRAWGVQLGLNGAWSYLFFGLHQPGAALVDVLALTVAVERYRRAAGRVDGPAAALVVPYLAWVGFAALLNAEVVRLNR